MNPTIIIEFSIQTKNQKEEVKRLLEDYPEVINSVFILQIEKE